EVLERFLGRYAGGDRGGRAGMAGVDRLGHRIARILLSAGDHHPRALIGHRLGDRAADAARRSGDDGDLAGKIEQGHQLYPPTVPFPRMPESLAAKARSPAPSRQWILTPVRMTAAREGSDPIFAEFEAGDRAVVHLVRPVRQAERADRGISARQAEIAGHATAAMRL